MTCSGIFGRSRKSSLHGSPAPPSTGRSAGVSPTQMQMSRATRVSPFTSTLSGPVNRAAPSRASMPMSRYALRALSGTGSTKVCLNSISRGQSIRGLPVIPCPFISPARCTVSAPLMSTFLGLHPRSGQTPPYASRSTMATFFPPFANGMATPPPAGPPPSTITSYSFMGTPLL